MKITDLEPYRPHINNFGLTEEQKGLSKNNLKQLTVNFQNLTTNQGHLIF